MKRDTILTIKLPRGGALEDYPVREPKQFNMHRSAEGWSIDEAIAEWGPMAVWFSLGSNSRVIADKARRMLGWKPRGAD